MANKLYVGNLSYNTTEIDLAAAFKEVGTVRNVTLIQDRATGQSRGFGFVTMSTDEEAANAIQIMHGRDVQGRRISVTEARPRDDRPPQARQGGGEGHSGAPGGGGRDRGGFPPRRPANDAGNVVSARPAAAATRPAATDDRRRPAEGASRPTTPAPRFQDPPAKPAPKQKEWEAKKPKPQGRPKPKDQGDDEFDEIDYRWR